MHCILENKWKRNLKALQVLKALLHNNANAARTAWDRAKEACQDTTDFSIFQQIETNSDFRRCTQQTLLNVFLICGKNVFTAGALYF